MNKLKLLVALASVMFLWTSCAKGPGEGGRASITGKIYAINYNNSYVAVDSGYLGGVNVYIKYGDEPGIADNTDTDPNGVFRFNYLRKGKYAIIAYSKKLVNNVLDSAVITNVEITDRKEDYNTPVIRVNTFKN